jgi:hypothetical protein
MKLKYDKLLSSFAFKFNLRRYIKSDRSKCNTALKKSKGDVCEVNLNPSS